MNQDQIEFNKRLGQSKRDASIKVCLHGGDDQTACSGKIIHAHSIQRGKILASIAEGNTGEVFYLGLSPAEDMTAMVPEFKREGIKKFSTFSGFCGGHDKAIFQPIEDVAFTATAAQLDIYAYRAAAKELHANMESKKACELLLGDKLDEDDLPVHLQATLPAILRGELVVPDFMLRTILQGAANQQVRMRHKHCGENIGELNLICDSLIGAIEHGHPSDFEHIYHSFDGVYPIACSTSFIPYFDHDGRRLISEDDEQRLARYRAKNSLEIKNVLFNIFPENNRTHVIFTFSKGDRDFKNAIRRLLNLDDALIRVGLSNILLNYSENTAFGPKYIEDNFSESQISAIKDIFSSTISDPRAFKASDINLFVNSQRPSSQ